MQTYFLTEGGKNSGFGHIARCAALSQALEEAGIKTRFLVDADKTAVNFLKTLNIEIEADSGWKNRLPGIAGSLVIVDSYTADGNIYTALKKNNLVVAIDDYNRINYEADVVICPAVYGEALPYEKKRGTLYLAGKDYVILRKDFRSVPDKKINKEVNAILLTPGGGETNNFIISLLRQLQESGKEIHLVTSGNTAVYDTGIKKLHTYSSIPGSELLKLMLYCDLGITGGGQTTYESARAGLPSIGICMARNQVMNLESLEESGFLLCAGWFNEDSIFDNIKEHLQLLSSAGERKERSKTGKKLIDGQGAKRIADILLTKYNSKEFSCEP